MAITLQIPAYQITVSIRHAEVDDVELRLYQDDSLIRSIALANFLNPGEPFLVSQLSVYRNKARDYAHQIWFCGTGEPERWPMEDGVFKSNRYIVNGASSQQLTWREIGVYRKKTARLCAQASA